MHVISRSKLLATLTGPLYSVESDRLEEFTAFANAILADAPPTATHFVFTDHENGDDPVVKWADEGFARQNVVVKKLIPLTYSKLGDYYGCDAERQSYHSPDDPRIIYQCYLGGCPVSSAPGFVITGATLD